MKNLNFPVHQTRVDTIKESFNLTDAESRQKYFQAKAGPEIEKLKKFLEKNTFVAYLIGKKNSGKGTYTRLFMEAVGDDHVGHVSIGDIVRDIHKGLSDPAKKTELVKFLEKNYRGFHTVAETIDIIEGRSQESLISSDLILALVKYEISKRPKKAIFIDGFPRDFDQISHSLYLKELIGYREDPDFLVFIDVPESVIDERIKYRVVCPKCHTPRNLKLLATKEVGYNEQKKEFYLICDDTNCTGDKMVAKEGDKQGIEPIRKRLEVDDQIFAKLLGIKGLPQIKLRNAVPVAKKDLVDDYEITPEFVYTNDADSKKVVTSTKPWVVKDDDGEDTYSLLPAAVAVSLIKQTAKVLGL